jgi:hypothetical protein
MRAARFTLVLAAAWLAAGGVAGDAKNRQRPFPEGLYGNVEYSEVSGDLGGFEVRFYVEAATGMNMAEFTLCEGWCNAFYTAEVTRDGDGFAFSHEEVLEFTDRTRGRQRVSYRVVHAGRGLKVSYASEDGYFSELWRIRAIRKPFGLDVARAEPANRRSS